MTIYSLIRWATAMGRDFSKAVEPYLKNAYISVDVNHGKLLYLTARAIQAYLLVEFGTSFGISTIYLGAAARANNGRVIGTELEPAKVRVARANVADAGLAQFVDIREGDAMQTLASLEEPIDFLLLDGWRDLYLPMIKMLSPKMRPRAVVLADNIFTVQEGAASLCRLHAGSRKRIRFRLTANPIRPRHGIFRVRRA